MLINFRDEFFIFIPLFSSPLKSSKLYLHYINLIWFWFQNHECHRKSNQFLRNLKTHVLNMDFITKCMFQAEASWTKYFYIPITSLKKHSLFNLQLWPYFWSLVQFSTTPHLNNHWIIPLYVLPPATNPNPKISVRLIILTNSVKTDWTIQYLSNLVI